jgi:hypothetical protein
MTSWFRSWHGAPTDTKWLAVAQRAGVAPILVMGTAWALFDYASQHEERGCVEGFDAEGFAALSGTTESEIVAVIDAMTAKGIITGGRLTAWEKRQPKREDDSTDRTRRYRERRSERVTDDAGDDVTHGDAARRDVTLQIQRREELETEERGTDVPRRHRDPDPPPEPVAPAPEPPPGQPYGLYVALCEELEADESGLSPSFKRQQLGIAKRLLEQGYGEDKVRRCLRFLRSQTWRTGPIDLRTIQAEIGRWELNGEPSEERARAPNGRHPPPGSGRAAIREFSRIMDEIEGVTREERDVRAADEPAVVDVAYRARDG